jgi:hypothetical protein
MGGREDSGRRSSKVGEKSAVEVRCAGLGHDRKL